MKLPYTDNTGKITKHYQAPRNVPPRLVSYYAQAHCTQQWPEKQTVAQLVKKAPFHFGVHVGPTIKLNSS